MLAQDAKGCVRAKRLPKSILVHDVFLWPILVCGIEN
jgi:hypothetical protein